MSQAPSETEQETLIITESVASDEVLKDAPAKITSQTDLHEQDAKVRKVNQFFEGHALTVKPFRLGVDSANLLAQAKSITDATMAARLREQNQKHQAETHTQLGIQAPMAAPATVVTSPKQPSYPVYMFRLEDGPTIARIKYKEQWIKVHPGMELVLRITSKGVTVREDGKRACSRRGIHNVRAPRRVNPAA